MLLDREWIDCLCDARNLIEGTRVIPNIRIVHQAFLITLEGSVVSEVETNQCRKQSPVGFCNGIADKIFLCRKPIFYCIEGCKQAIETFLVGLVRCGKTRSVHAIVDRVIDEFIHFVDLFS